MARRRYPRALARLRRARISVDRIRCLHAVLHRFGGARGMCRQAHLRAEDRPEIRPDGQPAMEFRDEEELCRLVDRGCSDAIMSIGIIPQTRSPVRFSSPPATAVPGPLRE